MSEMTEDEIRESFQVISITVSWGVEDILRKYPDWTVEQAEHFIDSSYQEIAAEAREAGDRMIEAVVQAIQERHVEASN